MDQYPDQAHDAPTDPSSGDGIAGTVVNKAREQIDALADCARPQLDSLTLYVKDEPMKSMLIAAAAGALIAAVAGGGVSRGRRRLASVELPSMPSMSTVGATLAGLLDTARSALDDARSTAADKADDAKKVAADKAADVKKQATDAADGRLAQIAKALLDARDSAVDTARGAADKAGGKWDEGLKTVREAGAGAAGSAKQAAERAYEELADTLKGLRDKASPLLDRVQPPLETVADYTKSSPFKALLIAAATAALVSRLVK